MIRRTMLLAALFVASPVAAEASAATHPRDLWATVNVCDATHSPNRVGVRARMPGNGTRERMYMRFTAQYRRDDGSWATVGGHGASRWLYAGSALFRNEELGWTYLFDPPKAGAGFAVRGLVDFQWRKHRSSGKWVTVHHARSATTGGHPTSESNPTGFSAPRCSLG